MADLVQMIERAGLSLATVMARKETDYGAIIAALGDGELHATGPGTWLAVSDASLDADRRLSRISRVVTSSTASPGRGRAACCNAARSSISIRRPLVPARLRSLPSPIWA